MTILFLQCHFSPPLPASHFSRFHLSFLFSVSFPAITEGWGELIHHFVRHKQLYVSFLEVLKNSKMPLRKRCAKVTQTSRSNDANGTQTSRSIDTLGQKVTRKRNRLLQWNGSALYKLAALFNNWKTEIIFSHCLVDNGKHFGCGENSVYNLLLDNETLL